MSLVRSLKKEEIDPEPSLSWLGEHLGFLRDEHQMNVGLTRARRGLCIIGEKNHVVAFFCQWTILIGSILTWQKNTNSHFAPLIVFVLFLTQSAPINITCKSDEGLAKGRDFYQTTVTDSGDLVSEWSHCFIVGLSRSVFCQFNILVLNKRFFSLRKQKSSWDGRNVEQVDRTLWK